MNQKTAIDLLKEFIRRTDPEWDISQRAQAFIQRSQEAEKVELPGWLARKIAWYILYLEDSAAPHQASNSLMDGSDPSNKVLGGGDEGGAR